MAHGTPLAVGGGENSYGAAGPFLLDVGISSSYRIAKFWGLTEASVRNSAAHAPEQPVQEKPRIEAPLDASTLEKSTPENWNAQASARRPRENRGRSTSSSLDVGAVITKALRAAGLMK
jgi:feruloyl esterase